MTARFSAFIALAVSAFLLAVLGVAQGHVVSVTVGAGGLSFAPPTATIGPHDAIVWTWTNPTLGHSVTQSTGTDQCTKWGPGFDADVHTAPHNFSMVFVTVGTYHYFCKVPGHCDSGMKGQVVVTAR